MAILYIFKKAGPNWTKAATGDGTLARDFVLSVTEGSVQKANTYQVRTNPEVPGQYYNCKKGAGVGEKADFSEMGEHELEEVERRDYAVRLQDFHLALAGVQKSVTITIDEQDLRVLKTNSYMFCFAKKVGDEAYNVVWQASAAYLSSNVFSWTPQYQLFGSNRFSGNVTVVTSTNIVDIGLGETSILDASGFLKAPTTGGPETGLTLNNQYGPIHPGVNAVSTGIDGKQASTPIYVAVNQVVSGQTTLTPVEKVLVWFEQNVVTSTMFSTSRSNPVEIDLTSANAAARLYKGGKWSTP